jgi:hypothetical protein
MSEHTPTHPNAPKAGAPHAVRKISCEEWEAMLVDFLDGTLPAADTEAFHSHDQSCDPCAKMLSQAGQGREWLAFLRVEPPVPAVLLSKILAQTSGSLGQTGFGDASLGSLATPASAAAIPVAPVLPFWRRAVSTINTRRMAQPRLMMTAAMAFFSITLTLNMAGVRLSAVRLADLKPSAISTNLDKQYHMASARVVRYYDSLRFVYEMEARVRELRRDADLENSAPEDKPAQPSGAGSPQDGGHKNGGKSEGPSAAQPHAMLWGERIEATLRTPFPEAMESLEDALPALSRQRFHTTTESIDTKTAGQAERGIA